jgi:chromosome transmission fidelity protein 18
VNASDDRSVASLRDIIARSMSNNTLDEHFIVEDNSARGKGNVMGSSKPNCIILDEIDGMDGREPIDALIAIAKAGLDSNKKHKGGGGASKKENIVLTRPVICICNDQFSPILRDLRKYAQVFPILAPFSY